MDDQTGTSVQHTRQSFTATRYERMLAAINACHSIDDCMEAQSVAESLAVYFKQANDTQAVDQLREIRLRAWRRMSDIIGKVNVSKCATQKAMCAKVRDELGIEATECLTDSRIIQLIKLSGVPDANFEKEVKNCNGSMAEMYRLGHPDAIGERQKRSKQQHDYADGAAKREEEYRQRLIDEESNSRAAAEMKSKALVAAVKAGAIVEAPEVGLTLTPHAKQHLVTFSIMMDRQMHDQLRDAAHERRTTMWAILREAANYWFVVNGYNKV